MSLNCIIYNTDIILTAVKINTVNGDVHQIPDYIQASDFHNLADNPYIRIDDVLLPDITTIEWQWKEKIEGAVWKQDSIRFSINDIETSFFENKDLSLIMKFYQDGIPDLFLHSKAKSYMISDNHKRGGYSYRYVVILSENEFVFEYIEEALYDNTHDKLHDWNLRNYHMASLPKKIRIQAHAGKNLYTFYYWFDEDKIRDVFKRFYGSHPETKTDFIINIDANNKNYELLLYRYGLKEPKIIPAEAYQLIVFKDRFENYRSDNYDQPRGAWIW